MRGHIQFLVLSIILLVGGTTSSAFAESAAAYIDDAAITAGVKEAFTADSRLVAFSHFKALEITVNTDHGTVFLSGNVDDEAQELEAIKIAGQVNGVVAVTDNLVVASRHIE